MKGKVSVFFIKINAYTDIKAFRIVVAVIANREAVKQSRAYVRIASGFALPMTAATI
jgi:hypothetical protein